MLAAQIMEKHFHAIAVEAKGIGVVITDTERFAMQGDHVVTRTDLLKTVHLPATPKQHLDEDWDWTIAPAPEEHPSHTISARIYERNVPEEKPAEAANDEPLHELPAEDGLTDAGA